MLNNGDRIGVIKNALSISPYPEDPDKLLSATYNFLTSATYAYKNSNNIQSITGNISLHGKLEAIDNINKITCSSDKSKILAIDEKGGIYVWDRLLLKSIYINHGKTEILNADFLDEKKLILVENKRIYKLEYETGKLVWEKKFEYHSYNKYLSMTSDRKTIVYETNNTQIIFLDADSGEILYIYEQGDIDEKFTCFTEDDRYFLYSTTYGEVCILNYIDGSYVKIRDKDEEAWSKFFGGAAFFDNNIIIIRTNENRNTTLDTFDLNGQLISSTKLVLDKFYDEDYGYCIEKILSMEIKVIVI